LVKPGTIPNEKEWDMSSEISENEIDEDKEEETIPIMPKHGKQRLALMNQEI